MAELAKDGRECSSGGTFLDFRVIVLRSSCTPSGSKNPRSTRPGDSFKLGPGITGWTLVLLLLKELGSWWPIIVGVDGTREIGAEGASASSAADMEKIGSTTTDFGFSGVHLYLFFPNCKGTERRRNPIGTSHCQGILDLMSAR